VVLAGQGGPQAVDEAEIECPRCEMRDRGTQRDGGYEQ
jgi:hypothetical protein